MTDTSISQLDYLDRLHGIFDRVAVHDSDLKASTVAALKASRTVREYLDTAEGIHTTLGGESDSVEDPLVREVARGLEQSMETARLNLNG